MLFDWLAREGWIILNWWILVTVAGATSLPLLFRLLGGLPDRGFTLARPAGMLLIGFVFWILAVLGFVDNSPGSVVLAWLIVLAISLRVFFTVRDGPDWRSWWRENRTLIISTEILFIVLLLGWAIYRAYQNNLATTEKPMDLAFMSAIQHGTTFPPNDPWLSGYAISYYYFGYVMAATMSMMAGVASTIGYNMHIALLFALAGTTAFGIGYNLVRARAFAADSENRYSIGKGPSRVTAVAVGLLAMMFLILMGNLQLPLVDYPYFSGTASEDYLEFWDVNQRREPIATEGNGDPTEWGYWWWFRSARSISDRRLDDSHSEVIAEFPLFSFVLGDSHPHVMALPFSLLAMGFALNVLLAQQKPDKIRTLLYGICVGGLIFLNTWDMPVYLAVLIAAEALRRWIRSGQLDVGDLKEIATLGLQLLAIGVVAYLPFILSFSSQLQGILPNLVNPTHSPQLFLMFGPFILVLGVFLLVEAWRGSLSRRMNWTLGVGSAIAVVLILAITLVAFVLFGRLSASTWNSAFRYVEEFGGLGEVVPEALSRRVATIATPIVLIVMLGLVVGRLLPSRESNDHSIERWSSTYPLSTGFVLLLIGTGVLLILVPEFVYLRDNFATRMNTVFKFYYQAWALFSIAATYAVFTVLADVRLRLPSNSVRMGFAGMLIVVVGAGLLYAPFAMYHRMFVETRRSIGDEVPVTLDGGPGFIGTDDYAVITCLGDLVGRGEVMVAEANPQGPNPNYNPAHGRVGALTGIPVIIGWPGHESQWRGAGYAAAVGTRQGDLDILYTDPRIDVAMEIIERYGIDYILYGSTERGHYSGVGEEKFVDHFEVVCESGTSRVYRVTQSVISISFR